eukprot:NODE_86_length_22075_cov_1.190253.p9 type:complete len:303 gc:universal NODE_86_length_22075_cov_1.190253:10995-11903(+)
MPRYCVTMHSKKGLSKFVLVHGPDNTTSWKAVNVVDPIHLGFFDDDRYDYNKHYKAAGDDPNAIFVPYDDPVDDFKDEELNNPDIKELIDALEDEAYYEMDEILNEDNLSEPDDEYFTNLVSDKKIRDIDDDFDKFLEDFEKTNNDDENFEEMHSYAQMLKQQQKEFARTKTSADMKNKIMGMVELQEEEYVQELEASEHSSEFESSSEEEWNCEKQLMVDSVNIFKPTVIQPHRLHEKIVSEPTSSNDASSQESQNPIIEIVIPSRRKGETKDEKKHRKELQKKANKLKRARKKSQLVATQ